MPSRSENAGSRRRSRSPLATGRILLACAAFWAAALWLVSRFPAIEAFGIRATVLSVRAGLGLVGLHVDQTGRVLRASQSAIEITPDCSPHFPYLIFAGVVLASPATWRQRSVGLVLGAVVIHLFNTARILALFAVLAARPTLFEFAHVYLWQIGTIVTVLGAFALWLAWIGKRPQAA
jgi:exosortase/archaeosortase family protein